MQTTMPAVASTAGICGLRGAAQGRRSGAGVGADRGARPRRSAGPSPARAEPSGCDRPLGRVGEDPPSDQNSETLPGAGCADAAAGRVGGL